MTFVLHFTALFAGAGDAPVPKLDPISLGIPFERYTTKDALGRTTTFYLSTVPKNKEAAKLPVALFIQGSGCQSLFRKQGGTITGGLQNLLLNAAQGRVRVLVVEKPGVKFLDAPPRPGSAQRASEEFLKEHTLPRWAEANKSALRAAWTLPDLDGSRSLLVGHSEGGLVAARIAAESPGVTHVASLAGGGPNQLFSLAESRGQPRPNDKPGDSARRMQAVYDEWAKVQADPDSITRFWLGHPHRRWSSFLKTSVTAELLRTKAKIFIAQGTLDTAVPVTSHDVLVAELQAHRRDITAERIEGADHGFRKADDAKDGAPGMQVLFGRVLEWFLTTK
ncbi:MAG: alpha/beta fold hydrolase [Planctomycetes bacterium]|nr:alpha/beta fold hydrolase [Planctomycetota bacterium]